MKLWRRMVIGVSVVLVGAPVLFTGTLYASAWYFRWRAEQLLACGKTIQPGVTQEADVLRDLKSIQGHVSYAHRDGSIPLDLAISKDISHRYSIADEYFLYNHPAWLGSILAHMPESGRSFISRYMSLDDVMFSVVAESQNGLVTGLKIAELSWRPTGGHAYASDVAIYSYRDSLDEVVRTRDAPFSGYHVDRTMLHDQFGRDLTEPVLFSQWILIDDRGTTNQRARALDFHLQCFTNWFGCRDAGQMLQPAPNP